MNNGAWDGLPAANPFALDQCWFIKRVNRCRTAVAVTFIASANSETLRDQHAD